MPYLIDGHNLIPKIPGLSLQAVDDEIYLIEMLQEFCRTQRRQIEVYFDNAPPGSANTRRFGQLLAHFVRQGQTADDAIGRRLAQLGKSASNWTVVSSDGAVQASARAARAQVLSSESFSRLLEQSLVHSATPANAKQSDMMSAAEIDEWLKLFGQNSEKPEPPQKDARKLDQS